MVACNAALPTKLLPRVCRLSDNQRRLARGELDTQVQIRTRDETASLVTSFNEMASALKARDEELRSSLQGSRDVPGQQGQVQVLRDGCRRDRTGPGSG